jgi:hypothetical protein
MVSVTPEDIRLAVELRKIMVRPLPEEDFLEWDLWDDIDQQDALEDLEKVRALLLPELIQAWSKGWWAGANSSTTDNSHSRKTLARAIQAWKNLGDCSRLPVSMVDEVACEVESSIDAYAAAVRAETVARMNEQLKEEIG